MATSGVGNRRRYSSRARKTAPDLSLRVDDHPDPLAELERLEHVSRERFVPFMLFLPSHKDPVGTTDRETIEAGIQQTQAAQAQT